MGSREGNWMRSGDGSQMGTREDSRVGVRKGRQDLPGQPVILDRGGWQGGSRSELSLRPLPESLSGEEFIMTVRLGKGDGDGG